MKWKNGFEAILEPLKERKISAAAIVSDERELSALPISRWMKAWLDGGGYLSMYNPAADTENRREGSESIAMNARTWILDCNTVVTGSFEFSTLSVKDAKEHVLVIRNREVVAQYLDDFRACWQRGTLVTKDFVRSRPLALPFPASGSTDVVTSRSDDGRYKGPKDAEIEKKFESEQPNADKNLTVEIAPCGGGGSSSNSSVYSSTTSLL